MHRLFLFSTVSAGVLLTLTPGHAQATTSTDARIALLQHQIQQQQSQMQSQQQLLQQQQQELNSLMASEAQTKTAVAAVKPPVKPSAIAVMSATHKPGWRSADGRNEIDLGALLDLDVGTASYRPEFKTGSGATASFQKMTSGFNVRRAQIQVSGTFEDDFHFALQYDLGGSNEQIGTSSNSSGVTSGFKTALFTYTGFKPYDTTLSLELGYTAPPVSIGTSVPADSLPFIEYPTPDRLQTFSAGPGIPTLGFRDFTNRWFVYYAFAGTRAGGEHDQGVNVTSGNSTGSQVITAVGRISANPIFKDNLKWQIGGGVERYLQPPSSITYSDEAEDRLDQTNIIGTGVAGTLANPVTGGGDWTLETSGEFDRLLWEGAYIHYDIERKGLPENDFWGAYGMVLYSLTGETHPYLPSNANWGNLNPAHPVSLKTGGWGAWELAFRYSYANLNSNPVPFSSTSTVLSDVDGGHFYESTVGVNWYISSNLKMQFNWMHGMEGGLPGPTGRPTNVSFYSPTLQNGNKAAIYNAHWDEFLLRTAFSF